MPKVITILCHGTDNSTNSEETEGFKLVITKIRNLLAGANEEDWILCEGAGTAELRAQQLFMTKNRFEQDDPFARHQGPRPLQQDGVPQARNPNFNASGGGGIFRGIGVEQNVIRAMNFVQNARLRSLNLKVNLAGHSRGSITCYKIAYALLQDYGTTIKVNIFAIDPVPGNTGRMNKEMYDRIALGGNVKNSFLMLAESEHRQTFRPYIDALYSKGGNEKNQFDTMPGTHGGINELKGSEAEAAALVLSRALRFLRDNGTSFNGKEGKYILDDNSTMDKYSEMMMKLKNYKAHASHNPFGKSPEHGFKAVALDRVNRAVNLGMSFANVERHRIVNVAGTERPSLGARIGETAHKAIAGKLGTGGNETKETWGTDRHQVTDANTRGRADHHGLNMGKALQRMGVDPHAERPHRFFANKEHEALFQRLYPAFIDEIRGFESAKVGAGMPEYDDWVDTLLTALENNQAAYNAMPKKAQDYFTAFLGGRR